MISMDDLVNEGTDQARTLLQQCRDEVLNATYTKLTKEYGFSEKRVTRALSEVTRDLALLDNDAILAMIAG